MIQILLIVSELCGIPLEQKRVVWNALNEIEMVYRLLDEDFHLLRYFYSFSLKKDIIKLYIRRDLAGMTQRGSSNEVVSL